MSGNFFTGQVLARIAASLAVVGFVIGGGYSVWRHEQSLAQPIPAAVKLETQSANLASKFTIVAEAPKKKASSADSVVPVPVRAPVQAVIQPPPTNIPKAELAPVPANIPAPSPAQAPVNTAPASAPEQAPTAPTNTEPVPPVNEEPTPPASPAEPVRIYISEVSAGTTAGGLTDEFVELYNPTNSEVNLAGWALKKKTSSGTESNLVSVSAFAGRIKPHSFFLISHKDFAQASVADLLYSANSNNLAYTNNSVVLYNAAGEVADSATWAGIEKDQSWERENYTGDFHAETNPNPQNSISPAIP